MPNDENQTPADDQKLSVPLLIAVLVIGAVLMVGFSFLVRPILHPAPATPAPAEVSQSQGDGDTP